MAVTSRRKRVITFVVCVYLLHAIAVFVYINFIKVHPRDRALPIALSDLGMGRVVLQTKLEPTEIAHMWTKYDVNTAYLNKVLSFHHQPKQNKKSYTAKVISIIVLLFTKTANSQTREVIRNTWDNSTLAKKYGIKTVFVMGLPEQKLKEPIAKESRTYGDMLVGNFTDGARTSTVKLLLGFSWVAQHCSGAKFVLYGGDHMFVHFERLVDYLKSLEGEELVRAWHGRRSYATIPVRDPQSVYYVSKDLYPRKTFPEYCTSEAGFILTIDAVKDLLEQSHHAPLVTIDDVFVSIIAEKLSFRLINNNALTMSDIKKDGCFPENAFTARMKFKTAEDFFVVYKNLSNPNSSINCLDPKLELVLQNNISNSEYFGKTLKMLISHDDVCFERTGERKDIFLMVLISSLPSQFDRRQAIRDTWGKQKEFLGKRIAMLFTLAIETKNKDEIQKKVRSENEIHGDIIQAEFKESFHNLTLKVVFGLKWLTENCPHAKYVYKGDDDMFVNMKNIIGFLDKFSKQKHKPLFMGNAMWSSVHIHDAKSKYHVSNTQYRGKYYPPYCSGGGYVISGNVIPEMYEASQWIGLIPIDDAFHGILAKKIGVSITHNTGFKVFGSKGQNTYKCFLEQCMVSHKYGTSESLHKAWSNFTDTSIKCPN